MERVALEPTRSEPAPPRVDLAWQLWLDGEIRRAPLPLADGLLVVLDRPAGSALIRLDEEGREVWQLELRGVASGDPSRTQGFVAVPLRAADPGSGTERVVVVELAKGRLAPFDVSVPGAQVRGGIAALGGRVWVRLGRTEDGLGPFLAVMDLSAPNDGLRLFPDPLGVAIETQCRRTNQTLVAAAEHPDGYALLVGLDETSARVLWRHEIPDSGLVDLWAAGGLVDVILADGVQSWNARTGVPLTRRFDGMALEGARLSGETLLVLLAANGHGRRLLAFDAVTEELRGELADVQRVVGASSDLALLRDVEGRAMLVELPTLSALALPEADAITSPELVAFSRHDLWVVAHGGRSLSALQPPS